MTGGEHGSRSHESSRSVSMRTISCASIPSPSQTSYSRAEVLRRCLVGARLKSTIDAQALTEVARVHADLNRIGGLLKLAIREFVSDRSSHHRLNLELLDSIIQVRRAVEGLAGRR